MRVIPAAVETLLKSRAQAGANAHNHLITLTGAPSNYGDPVWTDPKILRSEAGLVVGGGSFALRDDGKTLVTYYKDGDTMLSVVDTEEDIFYSDNESEANEWVFLAGIGNSQRTSVVKRIANGDLLLFVLDAGVVGAGGRNNTLTVYKSANGLGTDFSALEVVTIKDLSSYAGQHGDITLGNVIQITSTGRLIAAHSGYIHWFTDHVRSVPMCSYSDDNGDTWTTSIIYEALNTTTKTPGIGQIGTQLFSCWTSEFGSGSCGFRVSDNYGATWTALTAKTVTQFGSRICGGETDGYTYWIQQGTMIYRHDDSVALSNTGQDPYDPDEWELITPAPIGDDVMEILWVTAAGNIAFGGTTTYMRHTQAWIWGGIRETGVQLRAKRIEINRNKGMASSATVVFDNKGGIYSPDKAVGADWKNVMFPNNGILIDQGYGTELIRTFSGTIDDVVMTTFPAEITLVCRDYLKRAYDQLITSGGVHTITYANFTPEAMFTALAGLAGWAAGDIHTEVTGLTIAEKIFTNETYGDAFSWLADMCGFMVYCDEDGDIYYVADDDDAVPSSDYAFAEGEDIISLGYTISDRDLYNKIICVGDGVSYEVTYYNTYNILAGKKMIINASEATTEAQCQAIAEQARYVMNSRARICEFAAIANPYIQIKDTLTVTETTTLISELYNITDISTVQSPDGYIAQITAYHYAAPAES